MRNWLTYTNTLTVDSTKKCLNICKPIQKGYIQWIISSKYNQVSVAVDSTILESILHPAKSDMRNWLTYTNTLTVDSTNKCLNICKPIQKGYIQWIISSKYNQVSVAVDSTILESILHPAKSDMRNWLTYTNTLTVDSTNKCLKICKPIQKGYIQWMFYIYNSGYEVKISVLVGKNWVSTVSIKKLF